MIVKLFKDIIGKNSSFCGQLREILTAADYSHFEIGMFQNIGCTTAHYAGQGVGPQQQVEMLREATKKSQKDRDVRVESA